MNILHLEYFIEVARQGSFSRASSILHVSQPTISKMVQNLEEELGTTLINRKVKPLELTEAGQNIVAQAHQIVMLFKDLSQQVQGKNFKKGKLRIGLPPIASSSMIPPILGNFNHAYPDLQLQLFEYGSKKVELGVRNGSLDIGVICNIPASNDLLDTHLLVEDPFQLIVHPSHKLANCKQIDFAMLANEAFVLYSKDFSIYDTIINNFAATGINPRIIYETSQREFMTQMVTNNLGVALLPSKICSEYPADVFVAIPIKNNPIVLRLSLIWPKNSYLPFVTKSMIDFVTQAGEHARKL